MVARDARGRTGGKFRMPIERGKIREFARATGSDNPGYLEGHDVFIPPTFLVTQAFWQDAASEPWELAGLDLKGALHAEQEFLFHGAPPRAGTELTFQTSIEEVYERQGKRGGKMTFVVALTRYWDSDGRLVAEGRATAVETGSEATS